MLCDQRRIDAQQPRLGAVGVRRQSRDEHRAGPGRVRQPMRQQPARATFRHRELASTLAQPVDDHFLQGLAIAGKQVPLERGQDDSLRLLQQVGRADAAQVHLAQPRAVADFQSLDLFDLSAGKLLHLALTDGNEAVDAAKAFSAARVGQDFLQHGRDLFGKHRPQLARRSRQQEQVRRGLAAGRLARRQVQAGRGAVMVLDHGRAGGHLRLARDAWQEGALDLLEVCLEVGEDRRVFGHGPAEEFGGEVACQVVARRPEAAGDQHEVGASKRFLERRADGRPVGHADLMVDAQAEGEKFLAEKGQVGVGDVAEEEFGAGVDDFDLHRRGNAWGRRRGAFQKQKRNGGPRRRSF